MRGNGKKARTGNGEPPRPPEPPPPRSEQDDFVLPYEFTENALAHQFSERHAAQLVFCHEWNKWLRWDAGRWREDHTVSVYSLARPICTAAGEKAIATEDGGEKIAAAINKASAISGIERLARHDRRHERHSDDFDANRWMLNCPTTAAYLKG
jgi:phage/plasmid-associated DNA primase